jgi:hypothetical protein
MSEALEEGVNWAPFHVEAEDAAVLAAFAATGDARDSEAVAGVASRPWRKRCS